MEGAGRGSSRIADAIQGNQLVTFGGLGIRSWQSENLPPPDAIDLKSRVPSKAAGFQIFTDDENCPPGLAGLSQQQQQLAPGPSTRAHQRKQKLKQRPLQDMANRTKRQAVRGGGKQETGTEQATKTGSRAPLTRITQPQPSQTQLPTAAASRQQQQQSTAFIIFEDEPQPDPDEENKENVCPGAKSTAEADMSVASVSSDVCREVMRPAAATTARDISMTSPLAVHSPFEPLASAAMHRCGADAVFAYQEYSDDLHLIMRESELKHRAKPGFMARQPDITVSMRSILVDWLIEVNEEYKLCAETLHLAVSYIDRFLSVMTVVRTKLQLVGTTALFIAAKFEEIYPPSASEFVYITDDTYTASQLKRMEHVMLKMLAFDMSVPTSNWFLNYYIDYGGVTAETVKHLAQYLVELSLVQYELSNQYTSSVQAAAALSLALYTSGEDPWPSTLHKLTGYSLDELRPCVEELLVVYQVARDQPQQAVVDKFARDKHLSVSQLEPPAVSCWH